LSLKRKAGGVRNPPNFTTPIHGTAAASTYTHAQAGRGQEETMKTEFEAWEDRLCA